MPPPIAIFTLAIIWLSGIGFFALTMKESAEPDSSALSFMVNAKKPIPESQMIANVKIAIGGGINEPRDALLTILYGLLTHPEQCDAVRAGDKWRSAFEEGVRR